MSQTSSRSKATPGPSKAPLRLPVALDGPGQDRLAASAKARGPESYHRKDLRLLLIRKGIELLDQGGSSALSLREVARQVGVSQTAPGHHFGDRAGLLAAISAHGFKELTANRQARLSQPANSELRLRLTMLAYVEFALQRPALFHLMFGPEIPDKNVYPELRDASLASYKLLTGVVAEFLHNEGMRGNAANTAFLVWSAAHGLATLLIDRQQTPDFVEKKDAAQRCAALSDLLIAGLRANVPGS